MGEEKKEVGVVGDAILVAVHANMNVPGLVGVIVDGVLKDQLQKIVDDTSTPFDNVLMDALYPTLSAAVKVEVQKLWDGLIPVAPPVEAKPGELV